MSSANEIHLRARFRVRGVVQGVGFRPFLYRLATELGLCGFARNDSSGVVAEVEGAASAVAAFETAIVDRAPRVASVREVVREEIPARGERGFRIPESQSSDDRAVLIPPDVATCDACLAELRDPGDRRYRYPFINCTDCGPRYTIVAGLPYDRPMTTMREFEMCSACRREYEDPTDRRFHAQPVACPACGPRVWLVRPDGQPLPCADPVAEAVRLLEQGGIGAIKGLGGFHLACDATRPEVVSRLRERKRRPHKPFAVMVRDMAAAEQIAFLTPTERRLLEGWRRQILLLAARAGSPLAEAVGGDSLWVGAMLPYTPLHHMLLEGRYAALVMTSGNLADEPIAFENNAALDRLGGIADFFLLHDRPILTPADDSVARTVGERPALVRRSRGFVPEPILLPRDAPSVLAVGGDLKATACLTRGELAFTSQYIGDLEHPDAEDLLADVTRHLGTLLGVAPSLVVHDLHPDYRSTRFARGLAPLPVLAVQHHHAHALSCLADNCHDAPALAIALDGTGFGSDGAIWGGEVLLVDGLDFRRLAHLRYLPLPGGDRAAREPWRVAVAALVHALGRDRLGRLGDLAPLRFADPDRLDAVADLAATAGGCPRTSSAGRLFDAVASLLGICHQISYEAQAAVALERAAERASDTVDSLLPYEIGEPRESGGALTIDFAPMFRRAVDRIRAGVEVSTLARSFHQTLARALVEVCVRLRAEVGVEVLALSGGTLQNRLLSSLLERQLDALGFRVLVHHQVSPNDGGLALGQAWAGVLHLREQKER